MINYTEKGYGLHNAILTAGHSLAQIDGVWIADDEAAVQAIIDSYTLADAADLVAADIDAHAKSLRDSVVANISSAEMASWFIKRAEAIAFTASANPFDAPNLAAEAQARGMSLADLVAKVKAKADALSSLEAAIAGAAGKHGDAVKACTGFPELFAYDWHQGWPQV